MASGSYNTMNEWLSKISQDIAQALTCPDADIEFLTGLMGDVIGKQREGTDQKAANPAIPGINNGPGLPGPPPGPPPGLPPGLPPNMPGGGMPVGIPGGGGPPPAVPGLSQQASINPDEVRRLIGG